MLRRGSAARAALRRAALVGLVGAALAVAAPPAAADFEGLPLERALQILKERGLEILYSSDLVRPSMRVRKEARAVAPRAVLEEIVQPHGLAVRDGPNGLLILVRAPQRSSNQAGATTPRAPPSKAELEEVIVSASQYLFLREPAVTLNSISAADLELMPDLGDDPLRATARLPGTASSEFSARSNVRGGEVNETLVRFDGLNLYSPFHLKDFQSAFSAIGQGIVDEMSIYAGGFPVTFGDRMSGVIDIASLEPSTPQYRELSLSFFNASALAAGELDEGRGDWLVSGRRGNLDLMVDALDSKIGRPRYLDFYGRAGRRISETTRVTANALVSDDRIVLFDSDREEQARAEYRDAYYWLRFDYRPRDALEGTVLVSRSDLRSERRGEAEQDGIGSGMLDDRRSFAIHTLQTDWSWQLEEKLLLQLGGEWRGMRGRYDYRDEAQFDVLLDVPGALAERERSRELSVRPRGDHYAAYANLRFGEPGRITADAGLRWDRDTLSATNRDQLSPRLSILYSPAEHTHLRLAWGRFFQAQAISELQVSDGITQYFAPQRAHHLIGSLEQRIARNLDLRLEVYTKDYRQVRPRFENLLNTFVLLPELKPDRIRIAPERARAKGIELTLRGRVPPALEWWVSYSRSSVEDDFGTSWIPRSWDQRHFATGGVAWRGERWELSLAGAWHSGWPTTALTLDESGETPVIVAGARNALRLGEYSRLDARIARVFRPAGSGTLTVFLELSNVLNRRNDCCVEYEAELEDGELELDSTRLPYLPITPSLGVVWRF